PRDWSSDVSSSDLTHGNLAVLPCTSCLFKGSCSRPYCPHRWFIVTKEEERGRDWSILTSENHQVCWVAAGRLRRVSNCEQSHHGCRPYHYSIEIGRAHV